jgi:type I restriction enzyme S subunit
LKYKNYQNIKQVNSKWFTCIPYDWNLVRIKVLGKTLAGGTPKTDNPSYWENGTIPWLPSGKVQNNFLNLTDADVFITEDALNNSATKLIKPNSILVALTGGTCGNIAFLNFESTANQSVVAIEPNALINNKYLYYSLLAQREQIIILKSGGAQGGITSDDVRNLILALPSNIKEQIAIVNFIEPELEKIDVLIDKQKKLIDLLKEKLQAVISNAVTKGLDPKVMMKDSGVAWLGYIPEHWELKKIKWCVKLKNEKTSDRSNTIALENIESWTGRFIDTESEFEGDGVKFNEGDVLFGKLRPYLAKVFRATMSGEAIGDFFVLEPNQNLLSQFAERLFISSEFIDAINSSTYGTKMPRVNWEYFSSVSIPLPPKHEQMQISNYLVTAIEEMDELIATSINAVDLLEERRSALISAAVTGQIDVRNYKIKEAA